MPVRLLLALVACLLAGACARAPGEAEVGAVVAERLQAVFPDPVLDLRSLRRLGSGPLADTPDGAPRRIVYFNAQLDVARDYAFSDWEALNPGALAAQLGATERGLEGIKAEGNRKGDVLRVRGSATFAQRDGRWEPAEPVLPSGAVQPPENLSPARASVQEILALYDRSPVDKSNGGAARAVITDELARARQQIVLRLDRLAHGFTLAGGPTGGEYARIGGLIAHVLDVQGHPTGHLATDGSLENLRLLRQGAIDLAIVQNDIAALAYRGDAPFSRDGPMPELRALASLYPEPVQIVVRSDSPIRQIADLHGKRIDLGRPASGSRLTTQAVFLAHGLDADAYQSLPHANFSETVAALARGDIDAFASVIHAPADQMQRLAAAGGIRFVPLDRAVVEALARDNPAYVPLTLPAGTYPGQRRPLVTVAATAMLVSRADAGEAMLRSALDAVFGGIDFVQAGSVAGASISRRNALRAVTVPSHPFAQGYFGPAAAPRP